VNDAELRLLEGVLKSPSYVRADLDLDLLGKPELRPVRMQLELLKPEMKMAELGVRSTIVLFGSARICERSIAEKRVKLLQDEAAKTPNDAAAKRRVEQAERLLAKSRYYDEAREFAKIVSTSSQIEGISDYVILTGGGPGIMEAGNRGANDVAAMSVGLNITLPHEQAPNPYITPELCFLFRYFGLRKMHFLLRAKALVAYPGGYGTLDELFETLTLRQTHKMQAIPIILVGRDYWDRVIDFQFLADEGVISDEDLGLISYTETPSETWDVIRKFHNLRGTP
jgi:uncharacterized protein (TIGR00730 family)